jgi:phosphatidylserine/phosphatidylglycerophosphate/cardiolipin synthase-like enzyme
VADIDIRTLIEGGQTAEQVAGWLCEFLGAARDSLDLALYDFDVSPATAAVSDALRGAARRGVRVRIAHELEGDREVPVPPPPRTQPSDLSKLRVPLRAIPGVPDLMHHKYAVRDGDSVWTGSLNWTEDSWTREENLVAVVHSPAVASAFERDFAELWSTGAVEGTGAFNAGTMRVGSATVRVWFAPGRGRTIARRIAAAIRRARRRVRITSPIITAGPILGELEDVVVAGKVDVAGIVDLTQMREVMRQWAVSPPAAWKPPVVRTILAHAPFSGKRSTPWRPDATHDYMHAKAVIADDVVFLGSYNLSGAGRANAENVLEITDPPLAERLASFVDQLRARYPAVQTL